MAREVILESLREKLKGSSKQLVGNSGYRKYLRPVKEGFQIDEGKVAQEARYDGKWVLRTNLELSAKEVALKYKQPWMIEQISLHQVLAGDTPHLLQVR